MATSPIYNWPEPDNTDLVKNGALAMRTLGDAIDTTMATMTPKSIVDAKGDLIAASAADTPARLAVGNNGETLVADSSTSTGLRYTAGNPIPNPIINSCFDIAQRGTSVAVAASNTYTLDRWNCFRSGFATGVTVSRQSTNDTTNLPFVQYCARVQRDSGNTSTARIHFETGVETINSIPFAGKTVTISFYARAGANYSSTSNALSVQLYSGTGTDQKPSAFTGATLVANAAVTLTTTWQRFTATGTIGATATEIGIFTINDPTGTAGASDFYEITGVQVDIGSVALPVRRTGSTIQGELAACTYYFERLAAESASNGAATFAYGLAVSTTQVIAQLRGFARKRTTPSLTFSGNTDFRVFDQVTATATTSVGGVAASVMDVQGFGIVSISAVVASGLTQYRPYFVIPAGGSGTRFIDISSEL
jgi:hypothetical protein